MILLAPLVLLWACFCSYVNAKGVLKPIALFYDSSVSTLDEYSQFVQAISGLHETSPITFDVSKDEQEILLEEYQTLFILPCKSKLTSNVISSESLIDFSVQGGNVMILNDDEGLFTDLAFFLSQMGIHVAPKGYKYYQYHNEGESLTFLNSIVSPKNLQSSLKSPSVALLTQNDYHIPLLQTHQLSRSYQGSDVNQFWHLAKQGYFASASQNAKNGRTLWFGSLSPFQNESFDNEVVSSLVNWVDQKTGVIQSSRFNHFKVNDDGKDKISGYKVGDMIHVEIDLNQWNNGQLEPYLADDVQLELIMLDPYYRLTMTHDSNGHYETEFKLPHQHGVYTLQVDYKRLGLTYLNEKVVIPIRHLANDEFDRSWQIPNAWVYLTGYTTVTLAWLIFVAALLLNRPQENLQKKNV